MIDSDMKSAHALLDSDPTLRSAHVLSVMEPDEFAALQHAESEADLLSRTLDAIRASASQPEGLDNFITLLQSLRARSTGHEQSAIISNIPNLTITFLALLDTMAPVTEIVPQLMPTLVHHLSGARYAAVPTGHGRLSKSENSLATWMAHCLDSYPGAYLLPDDPKDYTENDRKIAMGVLPSEDHRAHFRFNQLLEELLLVSSPVRLPVPQCKWMFVPNLDDQDGYVMELTSMPMVHLVDADIAALVKTALTNMPLVANSSHALSDMGTLLNSYVRQEIENGMRENRLVVRPANHVVDVSHLQIRVRLVFTPDGCELRQEGVWPQPPAGQEHRQTA